MVWVVWMCAHASVAHPGPSTEPMPRTVRNPQLPRAALHFDPLELDPAYPFAAILDGTRDDQDITQLHVHDGLELGLCLEGAGTVFIGGKILPFSAGDMTVITDREHHRCRSNPGTRSRWAWFFLDPVRLLVPHVTPRLAWEPERFSGASFANVLSADAHGDVVTLLRQLIAESRMPDTFTPQHVRALLLVLIQTLHRRFPRPRRAGRQDRSARSFAELEPALGTIAQRYHDALTIPALARACGMPVRTFQARFTRLIGRSPQRYLQECRLQAAAAQLTDPSRPILAIAEACGFRTLSSFNRAFRATFRTNPRTWRARRGR